uniref:Gustatory receptor n=1 Tax=Tetranychus urticae TaxID=32264 RepID=T1KAR4_TETUR
MNWNTLRDTSIIPKFLHLKRFILDNWNKMQRFFSNFSSKLINNLDVANNDLLDAIQDLENFERSTKTLDRAKSCRYFQLQSLIILLLNSVIAIQFLVLSITDNETIRLYNGDIFVSSSERKVLNYFLHVGEMIPCMVKFFLLHLNQCERKSFLNMFDEYKNSLVQVEEKFILLSTNERSFRITYYILIKLYKHCPIMVCAGFALAHISIAVFNYSSLKSFLFQMVHIAFLGVSYYFISSSGLWFLFIMTLATLFGYYSIDSLSTECNELNSINHYTRTNALSFYYKINLLSNWMDCVNAQVASIFMALYVYLAFHNILFFFYLTQFTFDNLGVKALLIFSNVLISMLLYVTNYLGSIASQKASQLHLAIYRLSIDTGNLFNLKVSLKKLQVLRRIEARKMGSYVGNYIYVDNNFILLLTLECGSLYLLFCANINRNN